MTNDLIDFPTEGPLDKDGLLSDASGTTHIEIPSSLKPYVQKLISWPLICKVDKGEVDFRCYSDEHKKYHEMTIPPAFLKNLRYYLSGVVHELVHFNLSENLTPLFSVAKIARSMREKFTKAQKRGDQKTMEEMNIDLQLITMAHGLLDVYVNDGVTRVDRNLSREDLKIFRDMSVRTQFVSESFDFNFLASLALHVALIERDSFQKESLPENPLLTYREWVQGFAAEIRDAFRCFFGNDQFSVDLINLSSFISNKVSGL